MTKASKALGKTIFAIDKFNGMLRWPSGILLMALTSIVIYEVIMRYFFNRPTLFSHEVSQMIQVGLAIIGSGYVLKTESHVNVDVIFTKMSRRWQAYFGFAFSVLGAFYCGILAWLGWMLMKASFSMVEHTLDIGAPLWPIKGVFVLGMCFFGLQFIVNSYNYYLKFVESNHG